MDRHQQLIFSDVTFFKVVHCTMCSKNVVVFVVILLAVVMSFRNAVDLLTHALKGWKKQFEKKILVVIDAILELYP